MAESSVGELLSELNEQLSVLQSESSLVKDNIKGVLEKKWPLKHAELFPLVCHWRENIGSSYAMAYHHIGGSFSFEPFLSYGSGQLFPTQFSLKDLEQQSQGVSSSEELIRGVLFALASREMQVIFETGDIVLPFQLFEGVTGVFCANVEGLSGREYTNLVSVSQAFLQKMRKVISGQVQGLVSSGVRAS